MHRAPSADRERNLRFQVKNSLSELTVNDVTNLKIQKNLLVLEEFCLCEISSCFLQHSNEYTSESPEIAAIIG